MDSRQSSTRNIYKDEEELRLYLDTQTQAIIESIQTLLTRIRNRKNDSVEDFRPQIDEITLIVEKIVEYTDRQSSKIDRLRGEKNRLMTILRQLEDSYGSMKNVARTPPSRTMDSKDVSLGLLLISVNKSKYPISLTTLICVGISSDC